MDDIQPDRNFLTEIQGTPELVYTQAVVEALNRLKDKVKAVVPASRQQEVLQQQALKKMTGLQHLIQDYEQEINDAFQFLGAVTETEKKHLQSAFQKIKRTEQELQALLAQLG